MLKRTPILISGGMRLTLQMLAAGLLPGDILAVSSDLSMEISVSGVSSDARRIGKDELFIAVRGTRFDGHTAIADAARRGACAVILEDAAYTADCPLPWILVRDTRAVLLPLMLALRGHPERGMRMIAVTGTNGKTSVTYLLEAVFAVCGKTAVFGTVENRIAGTHFPASHTTPDPDELVRLLETSAKAGVRTVILEASSHALAQKRLSGLTFSCGIFLNLTEDHLDYHKTTEDYYLSKRSLFFSCEKGLCNTDDPFGRRLFSDPAFAGKLFSFSPAGDPDADFSVREDPADPAAADKERRFLLTSPDGGTFPLLSPLPGSFVPCNTLASAACAFLLGVSEDRIRDGIRAVSAIPGRMERIVKTPFSVILDYAHTPDALEKALLSARTLCKDGGKLRVLFGCGGDREREKRPKMGAIAARLADAAVITSDNSRTEPPLFILAQIVSGIPDAEKIRCTVIPDRRAAIAYLLSSARPGDCLLLAGKGHETYEIDSLGRRPFSERDIVAVCMNTRTPSVPGFRSTDASL